jgi:hypothetical protein
MTALLLDHPWRLDEALNPRSDGFRVLEQFVNLVRENQLDVAPFVSRTEYDEMWQRIDYGHFARTRAYASLVSFAEHLVRNDSPTPLATPIPEPPMLTQCWKRGLRQAMGDLRNWRNPQIIVAEKRQPLWPATHEVPIQLEDLGGAELQHRVLAPLERYDSHPFAVADLDPWDLRHLYPPIPEVNRQHPCRLPRPPVLQHAQLERLIERMGDARAAGWRVGGRHYFVPPEDWQAEHVNKVTWRSGRAFRYQTVPARGHAGPVDYSGRVWLWDRIKRHWDVQESAGYVRISHTGEPL